MSNVILDGVTFDAADFPNYGYLEDVSVGGVNYERFIAMFVAWLRDAGKALKSSSTTSVTVGAGSKSFTLDAARPWAVGANIKATSAADVTKWMFGTIESYDGNLALTITVDLTNGSGSAADWEIIVQGPRGPSGSGVPGGGAIGDLLENSAPGVGVWSAPNTLGFVTQGEHALPIMARALEPTQNNGCGALEFGETTTNAVPFEYRAFDMAIQENAYFMFRAPKSADESAGFRIRNLTWSHSTGGAAFGVVWEIDMLALGNDDPLDTAFGTALTVSDTGGTDDDIYVAAESTAITPGNTWTEGDLLILRLARKVADAGDTLDIDARLHGFELIITTNAGNDG